MEKTQKIKFIVSLVFAAVVFAVLPTAASAATLYFSPSSGSHAVGATLSVGVYVSSADQAMNAASGVISYPADKVEVVSFSKSGSIISLWVQEPTFSNSAGTVNFEGIALNPGFTGASGKLITVNFRVKAAGAALLSFSSGSVLANDGKGTNILASLGAASFSLGVAAPSAPETITPIEAIGVPAAPVISSPTHPDPNKWYAKKDAKFVWKLPSGATGVRTLVGRVSNAIPTVTYVPAINSKELPNLADGIWYFSVRLRNKAGWGNVSHFRFQIDTEKPEYFEITEIERKDKTEPQVKFIFKASDNTSGIDHFEVQIDGGEWQIWRDDGSHTYKAPVSGPGKRMLIAKAVDKAGNFLANSAEFFIEAVEPPVFVEYPKELRNGDLLVAKGKSYPDAQINFIIEKDGEAPKNQIVKSDADGNFIFVFAEKVKEGIYKLWAEATKEDGSKSNPTDKFTVAVQPPQIVKAGRQVADYLSVLIAVIASLLLLVILISGLFWYSRHKFSRFKRILKKETKEAEEASFVAFDLLKEDIRRQIKILERAKIKRELTEEEKELVKRLKKDLEESEKLVKKEIKDIEKEVK